MERYYKDFCIISVKTHDVSKLSLSTSAHVQDVPIELQDVRLNSKVMANDTISL